MVFFFQDIYTCNLRKFLDHNCRNLSNEELKETYKIDSSSLRERLMHAIVQATREELETDTEVVYDFQNTRNKNKKWPVEFIWNFRIAHESENFLS